MQRSSLALVGFLAICGLPGCSDDGPNTAVVKGEVTLDGAPLPEALVFFRHDGGGRTSEGMTDENGRFEMEFSSSKAGAIIGPNVVRISTFVEATYDDSGKLVPGTGKKERVPKRYNQNSELRAEVESGVNEFKFELTSSK